VSDISSVVRSIIAGDYDDDLETLANAISERRKEKRRVEATVNRLTLLPGTRVGLKGLSPKRLNSKKGVVVENTSRHRTAIAVKLDGPVDYRFGEVVHVPASCVYPV